MFKMSCVLACALCGGQVGIPTKPFFTVFDHTNNTKMSGDSGANMANIECQVNFAPLCIC